MAEAPAARAIRLAREALERPVRDFLVAALSPRCHALGPNASSAVLCVVIDEIVRADRDMTPGSPAANATKAAFIEYLDLAMTETRADG